MKLAPLIRHSGLALVLAFSATARAEDDDSTDSLIRQLLAIQTRQLKAIEAAQAQSTQIAELQTSAAAVAVETQPAAAPAEVTLTNAKAQPATGSLSSPGLTLSRLQPATGLQTPARGLSSLDDWRQLFPAKRQK